MKYVTEREVRAGEPWPLAKIMHKISRWTTPIKVGNNPFSGSCVRVCETGVDKRPGTGYRVPGTAGEKPGAGDTRPGPGPGPGDTRPGPGPGPGDTRPGPGTKPGSRETFPAGMFLDDLPGPGTRGKPGERTAKLPAGKVFSTLYPAGAGRPGALFDDVYY